MIWTFFTRILTLTYATRLFSSVSFSTGWTVSLFLWSPLNFVFVLDQAKTGITDSNFFVVVWSKDLKENQSCQFFSAMTGLDILTVPVWQQFVTVYMGTQQPAVNGIILFFCAYSCHITWLVSGSDFFPDHLPVRLQNYWLCVKNVNRMRWRPLLSSWSSVGISSTLSLRANSNMQWCLRDNKGYTEIIDKIRKWEILKKNVNTGERWCYHY